MDSERTFTSAPVISFSVPHHIVSRLKGEIAVTTVIADRVESCIASALGVLRDRHLVKHAIRIDFCIGASRAFILVTPADRLADRDLWQLHFLTTSGRAGLSGMDRRALERLHLEIAACLVSSPEAIDVDVVRYH